MLKAVVEDVRIYLEALLGNSSGAIAVRGNHIVTHLNGVRVVDYTDSAPKFTDGVIALQIHTGGGVRVRWKDIYVQENRQ